MEFIFYLSKSEDTIPTVLILNGHFFRFFTLLSTDNVIGHSVNVLFNSYMIFWGEVAGGGSSVK